MCFATSEKAQVITEHVGNKNIRVLKAATLTTETPIITL